MANTNFQVDLGKLELTEAQKSSINAAIQQAVTGELAKMNLKNQVALIPMHNFIKGPILSGLVVRNLDEKLLGQLIV